MAVSTTFKQANKADAQIEIEIPGLGSLEPGSLDLDGKQYGGSIYELARSAKQAILEALGFSARFEHGSVRNAYLNIASTEASIVLEIAKNVKPNEVAVRYSGERWQTERASTTSDGTRPWLKNTYRCRQLTDESTAIICDALAISRIHLEKFLIRIDLKGDKAGLLVEAKSKEFLPRGELSSFSLPKSVIEETKSPPPKIIDEPITPTKHAEETTSTSQNAPSPKPKEANMNSTQPRYATYSQSEVDQLLRQQSEQMTALIQSKITSQRKEIAESLKANEKQLKQIADDMKIQSEDLRKKLEQSHNTKASSFAESSAKASAELNQQVEAFKNHVNKNILPSLKNLDARILSILKEAKPEAEEKQESKAPLMLSSLAVVLSVISLILNFVKH
jgi:hypothetical protein